MRERESEEGGMEGMGGFVSFLFVGWKRFPLVHATCIIWSAYAGSAGSDGV